jgi:hypothetical protein
MFFAVSLFKTIKSNIILIFVPSFICLFYSFFNLIFGSFAYAKNLGMGYGTSIFIGSIENIQFITLFFLLSNFILFYVTTLFFKSFEAPLSKKYDVKIYKKKYLISIIITLFLFFSFFNVKLDFLGGSGSFSYPFVLILVIIYSCYVSFDKSRFRYLFYLFFVGMSLISHYNSKREIFFILISILFFEVLTSDKIKLNIKSMLSFLLVIFLFSYIIIMSSIARGYGGYQIINFWDANSYIYDYITSDFFWDAYVNNLEVSYSYINSSRCIDLFIENENFLYGTTLFKILLLPFPRYILPEKLSSMVDVYTRIVAPAFRAKGGSLPVILYSELFANFYLVGLLFLYFIFKYLNKMYAKIVYLHSNFVEHAQYRTLTLFCFFIGVFLLVTIIQFFRGGGIDLYIIYPLISCPFLYFLLHIFKLIGIKIDFKDK